MIEYWNCVCTQSELSVQHKRKLAAPLFASIKKYSEEFFELCAGLKFDDDGNADTMKEGNWELAWKGTLFGKLDVALQKLVEKYIVFSFYG